MFKYIRRFLKRNDPGVQEIVDMIKEMRREKPRATAKVLHSFVQAAVTGDVATMHQLLSLTDFDINTTDKNLLTPLIVCAKHGPKESLVFLLEEGADPLLQDMDGRTALIYVIQRNEPKMVLSLIKHANGNSLLELTDRYGYTPLLWAVNLGYIRIVAILLEAGANALACDPAGLSALHVAIGRGFDRVAEQLLEAGADPMAVDHYGKTPMDLARVSRQERLLPLLYEHGGKEPESTKLKNGKLVSTPTTPTSSTNAADVSTPTVKKQDAFVAAAPVISSTPPRPQYRKSIVAPASNGVALRPTSIGRKRSPSSVINEMNALLNGSFVGRLDKEIDDVDLSSEYSDSLGSNSPTKARIVAV